MQLIHLSNNFSVTYHHPLENHYATNIKIVKALYCATSIRDIPNSVLPKIFTTY